MMMTTKRQIEGGSARNGNTATRGLADWLSLAAAPIFVVMALLTSDIGSGSGNVLCSAMQDSSPLGGMVAMYVLMSVVHLPPWLKLMSGVWTDARAGL